MPRTPLRMPKMSMTMEEGELGTWLVAVGETVESGQPVCEVATDKVDMEVESPAAGTIVELAVEPGTTVPVGEPLAWIDTETDSLLDDLLDGNDGDQDPVAEPAPEPASESASEPAPEPVPEPGTADAPEAAGIVPAIPRARRLAAENSLDLRSVHGTGPGGAVLVGDVRQALQVAEPEPEPEPQTQPTQPEPVAPTAAVQAVDGADAWAVRAAALAPRPHPAALPVTAWRDVVLGPAAELEESRLWAALAVALSRALAAEAATGWAVAGTVPARPRIGLAVPTRAGTVTVTLPELDGAGIDAAHAVAGDAVAQARAGRVDVAFLAGSDALISVHDGVDRLSVPPPATGLLGLAAGSAIPRVVAADGNLAVRTTVGLSVTAEPHRADSALLARVLARVAAELPGLAGLLPTGQVPGGQAPSGRTVPKAR